MGWVGIYKEEHKKKPPPPPHPLKPQIKYSQLLKLERGCKYYMLR